MDRTFRFAIAVIAGAAVGLGAYAFVFARGYSYFSNRREACANCHVMRQFHTAWNRGGHRAHAACNDCHAPHAAPARYLSEARDGFRHSATFTLQNFPDPIRLRAEHVAVIEANCRRCHPASTAHLDCVCCHRTTGHRT